jgi:hypothetical protein
MPPQETRNSVPSLQLKQEFILTFITKYPDIVTITLIGVVILETVLFAMLQNIFRLLAINFTMAGHGSRAVA